MAKPKGKRHTAPRHSLKYSRPRTSVSIASHGFAHARRLSCAFREREGVTSGGNGMGSSTVQHLCLQRTGLSTILRGPSGKPENENRTSSSFYKFCSGRPFGAAPYAWGLSIGAVRAEGRSAGGPAARDSPDAPTHTADEGVACDSSAHDRAACQGSSACRCASCYAASDRAAGCCTRATGGGDTHRPACDDGVGVAFDR